MPKHWKRPKNIVAAKSHFEHAGDCSEDERGHGQLTRGESDGAVDAPNDGCASVSRRRRSRSTDFTPRRAATAARGSYAPWWSRGLPAPYAQLRHLSQSRHLYNDIIVQARLGRAAVTHLHGEEDVKRMLAPYTQSRHLHNCTGAARASSSGPAAMRAARRAAAGAAGGAMAATSPRGGAATRARVTRTRTRRRPRGRSGGSR